MVKNRQIIGIDEVGRGPLAGPVAVCALVLKCDFDTKNLRDSKKLSPKQREVWFEKICAWKKEKKLDFKIAFVSASIIDKIGISKAIKKALEKSLYELKPKNSYTILLDGGLKAPIEFKNQETIIKGDEKEVAIALASIVAKVSRDALMTKISKKFPQYEFHLHKGYGTKLHYERLKKHGLSQIHRKTFLKKMF
jgi:ribonuclease HII